MIDYIHIVEKLVDIWNDIDIFIDNIPLGLFHDRCILLDIRPNNTEIDNRSIDRKFYDIKIQYFPNNDENNINTLNEYADKLSTVVSRSHDQYCLDSKSIKILNDSASLYIECIFVVKLLSNILSRNERVDKFDEI